MTEPTTDDLIELCSAAARKEVCDLMECLRPADLTTCEVLAIVAVLRSARERLDATKREARSSSTWCDPASGGVRASD